MNDGHITVDDLYKTIDLNKLGKIPGKLKKNTRTLRKYLGKVYMDLMELVVDDIIENNVTFNLTLMFERKGTIQIKSMDGEKFERWMRNGLFDGLDFLKTNFTGYMMCYSSRKTADRYILLDKKNKKRIIEKANEGMKYF